MKTTLNIRDDLIRRAKARAALKGQPLARYIEEGLEQRLQQEETLPLDWETWLKQLPEVSNSATRDLVNILNAEDFRTIDVEMWK